ncbi:6-phosphogluconate dehydrogenase [Sphingomonas abaci]|uniref:6-phosphogluconate dehydrogenase n=2 Tax=Sphingomonas abaci TaxID=237611 RepID=A0A7W7AKP2_9SPHN|nr:6-phosphogluconate dehydrogenase [Sphingomonas abaci]
MKIGMIGLGRMGGNMARRLMAGGHQVVAYDRDADAVAKLTADGAEGVGSLDAVRDKLDTPAIWWVMLPAGEITEGTIAQIAEKAKAGDIIIDGGNSFYKDDIRRAKMLRDKGIEYVDVGTSGGVWGKERGYCMMIGAEPGIMEHLDPIFETLAPGAGTIPRTPGRIAEKVDQRAEKGYIHAGPAGAGHFVKMIHNGIEYGLMQAYAEGFDILKSKNSDKLPEDERFDLNLTDIAEVWRRGSVISSWLLDLTAIALAKDEMLAQFSGHVADSGEGQWTIDAAMEEKVPANVLTASLFARYRSRVEHTFGDQVLSAMRFGFGGHVEIPQ